MHGPVRTRTLDCRGLAGGRMVANDDTTSSLQAKTGSRRPSQRMIGMLWSGGSASLSSRATSLAATPACPPARLPASWTLKLKAALQDGPLRPAGQAWACLARCPAGAGALAARTCAQPGLLQRERTVRADRTLVLGAGALAWTVHRQATSKQQASKQAMSDAARRQSTTHLAYLAWPGLA
ncbi:uncharacterized protein PSFLO_06944 [Pseudozyma flocculosa]|uniref:Uncharacterized protein n=1 Tax=Pseudozyma flocculosa TaxID=84751 RepID=A0A5C3FAN7_9BASI|nr:uncharacterized protein PSFLO_06944 [Pseudozyma flocculosa]